MCGISAILRTTGQQALDVKAIERMNDALMHRGPDGAGVKLFSGRTAMVALGHRRLSIIDLTGGHQPMANEDGTIWISYNGEIYNHAELRGELVACGHRFQTCCDTEIIIHAFEEWGDACVDRFRGMFAFVIWDSREERLFVARDRMGIKPLYYLHSNGNLVCASEIKAIVASGHCAPQLSLAALSEHLTFGYLCGNETLFQGIHKLLPGHCLSWKKGELRIWQYWEIPHPGTSLQSVCEHELIDRFLRLFRESVQLRLMSDVPLGVFLSGGLDSSAIAAVMAEQMSEPVKTFSVGFEADYYSEFNFAREVASVIGADHHEVVLKPDRMFALLPRLIWHEDEPIRNPSSVALFEVASLAQSHVKVVLTGEGSDELFAGYERYWATLINMKLGSLYQRLTPGWLRNNCIRSTLWRWPLPLSVKKKLSHTFLNYSLRPEEIVFENWHSILPPSVQRELLTADTWNAIKSQDPYSDVLRIYQSRSSGDTLSQLLFTDQKTYLVELLRKQDTMSMAASIESRVPFLDHKIVEFAAQVPTRYKIRGFTGKHLVKQAMHQMLPESIIKRKKMGFPVPISQWFRRGPMHAVHPMLAGDRIREHGIFNIDYLTRLIKEHCCGVRDHSDALWTVLNFELWTRVFIDGEDCSSVADELASSARHGQASTALDVA